jgi:hypothetical protein
MTRKAKKPSAKGEPPAAAEAAPEAGKAEATPVAAAKPAEAAGEEVKPVVPKDAAVTPAPVDPTLPVDKDPEPPALLPSGFLDAKVPIDGAIAPDDHSIRSTKMPSVEWNRQEFKSLLKYDAIELSTAAVLIPPSASLCVNMAGSIVDPPSFDPVLSSLLRPIDVSLLACVSPAGILEDEPVLDEVKVTTPPRLDASPPVSDGLIHEFTGFSRISSHRITSILADRLLEITDDGRPAGILPRSQQPGTMMVASAITSPQLRSAKKRLWDTFFTANDILDQRRFAAGRYLPYQPKVPEVRVVNGKTILTREAFDRWTYPLGPHATRPKLKSPMLLVDGRGGPFDQLLRSERVALSVAARDPARDYTRDQAQTYQTLLAVLNAEDARAGLELQLSEHGSGGAVEFFWEIPDSNAVAQIPMLITTLLDTYPGRNVLQSEQIVHALHIAVFGGLATSASQIISWVLTNDLAAYTAAYTSVDKGWLKRNNLVCQHLFGVMREAYREGRWGVVAMPGDLIERPPVVVPSFMIDLVPIYQSGKGEINRGMLDPVLAWYEAGYSGPVGSCEAVMAAMNTKPRDRRVHMPVNASVPMAAVMMWLKVIEMQEKLVIPGHGLSAYPRRVTFTSIRSHLAFRRFSLGEGEIRTETGDVKIREVAPLPPRKSYAALMEAITKFPYYCDIVFAFVLIFLRKIECGAWLAKRPAALHYMVSHAIDVVFKTSSGTRDQVIESAVDIIFRGFGPTPVTPTVVAAMLGAVGGRGGAISSQRALWNARVFANFYIVGSGGRAPRVAFGMTEDLLPPVDDIEREFFTFPRAEYAYNLGYKYDRVHSYVSRQVSALRDRIGVAPVAIPQVEVRLPVSRPTWADGVGGHPVTEVDAMEYQQSMIADLSLILPSAGYNGPAEAMEVLFPYLLKYKLIGEIQAYEGRSDAKMDWVAQLDDPEAILKPSTFELPLQEVSRRAVRTPFAAVRSYVTIDPEYHYLLEAIPLLKENDVAVPPVLMARKAFGQFGEDLLPDATRVESRLTVVRKSRALVNHPITTRPFPRFDDPFKYSRWKNFDGSPYELDFGTFWTGPDLATFTSDLNRRATAAGAAKCIAAQEEFIPLCALVSYRVVRVEVTQPDMKAIGQSLE